MLGKKKKAEKPEKLGVQPSFYCRREWHHNLENKISLLQGRIDRSRNWIMRKALEIGINKMMEKAGLKS